MKIKSFKCYGRFCCEIPEAMKPRKISIGDQPAAKQTIDAQSEHA